MADARTFEYHGRTFRLEPVELLRLRFPDLGPGEHVLRVPHQGELSKIVGEPVECVVGDFGKLYRRAADRPEAPAPTDPWERWHAMEAPPGDYGQPRYWRIWLQWAVAQFELFRDLPQPSRFEEGSNWARAFERAAEGQCWDRVCDELARHLLDQWNDGVKWKLPRAKSLVSLAQRLDDENRRGLARLVLHVGRF